MSKYLALGIYQYGEVGFLCKILLLIASCVNYKYEISTIAEHKD